MGPGRTLRIRRQLGHQHWQRLSRWTAVLLRHLGVPWRWPVRACREHGHQGRADRGRRARARQSGQGRVAGMWWPVVRARRRATSSRSPRPSTTPTSTANCRPRRRSIRSLPRRRPSLRRLTRCRPRCPTRLHPIPLRWMRRCRLRLPRHLSSTSPSTRRCLLRRRRCRRSAGRRHGRRARRQLGRRSATRRSAARVGPARPSAARSRTAAAPARPPGAARAGGGRGTRT